MAKDESQNGTRPSVHPDKRVYKSSDVHKRRPAPKGKKKSEEPIVEQSAPAVEQAPALTAELKADSRTAPIAVPEEKPELASDLTPRPAPTPRPKPERKRKERKEAPLDEPVEELGEGSSEEPADGKPKKPKKKPRWKLRIGLGIVLTIIVALAVTAGVFSWNRWLRYDDAADMRGTWYAYGTKVPVEFTENSIVFDENTAYKYEIDPEAKTIKYSIGDIDGQGRYWYSDDRTVLIITDGDGYTKWGTVYEDLSHWFNCLFKGTSLPMTENSIAFSRLAMSEGLAKVEPQPTEPTESSSQSTQSESSSAAEQQEGQGQQQSESSSSSSSASGEPASDKAALSQMPISDIILEDNTPTWGEGGE